MKKLITTIRYSTVLFHLLLLSFGCLAQVQITTHVLPPYQSRIADYASRPELMLVTLTNTSTSEVNVQLTAKISGDNGISAWVKAGHRSPRPITIPPGQTISLNGNDISFLFDSNKIDYTGISRADMTRGLGLLEGNYTLCIRALQYTTLEPMSPAEPLGCTSFRITDTEPPRILTPFADQVIDTKGVQAFPITWSTPPGSPPGTQYKVKIVEMIVPRNPNDAIRSSRPLLEETVNTNMLLYGPAHPALVQGRQYVIVVQAEDPLGRTFFRNLGMSEVQVFTYGKTEKGSLAGNGSNQQPVNGEKPTQKYATNTIKGKLLWAFKRSEEQFFNKSSYRLEQGAGSIAAPNVISQSVLATHYLGYNPTQANQATALAHADPTMNTLKFTNALNSSPQTAASNAAVDAKTVMSANGATSLALQYEQVKVDSGTNRYPLANTKITIRGVKSPFNNRIVTNGMSNAKRPPVTQEEDNQWAGLRTQNSLKEVESQGKAATGVENMLEQIANNRPTINNTNSRNAQGNSSPQGAIIGLNGPNVLATGRTDAEGNFIIHMMDPKYSGDTDYERIVVTVETEGFETFEYSLATSKLASNTVIDLGEQLLLAKTYRLNPKLQIEAHEGEGLGNPGMRIKVLRLKEEIQKNPYLAQEGGLSSQQRTEVVLNGQTYITVASDSIGSSDNQVSTYDFTFAQLFYTGKLRIAFEAINPIINPKEADFRLVDAKLAATQILLAQPSFTATLVQPAVSGQVILKAGENLVPVAGAVLSVTYQEEDKIPVSINSITTAALLQTQTAEVKGLSALLVGANTGVIKTSDINQSGSNVNRLSSAVAVQGIAQPMQVNTSINSNLVAEGVAYTQPLNLSDEHKSEAALRQKYGQYTVKTDSTGQYYIGNLPLLKAGASYTVKLISVPSTYKDLEVAPGMEQQFVAGKGITETRSFTISPEVFNIVGRVIDAQKQGIPYARAHFKGSSNYFETGAGGVFQTSYYRGKHTLIIEKEGFLPLEIKVDLVDTPALAFDPNIGKDKIILVTVVQPGQEVMNMNSSGGWVQSVQNTATVHNAISAGATFSPAMFGNAAGVAPSIQGGLQGIRRSGPVDLVDHVALPAQLQLNQGFQTQINRAYRNNLFTFSGTDTKDLGDVGPMLPRVGKVRFTVVNKESGVAIPDAEIELFDSLQYTDNNGVWLYEGFGGTATVNVKAPEGSDRVPVQKTIRIDETGKITEVKIELEQGVRVYGMVRSGSTNLVEAVITVEGRDYLRSTTDAAGNYEIYLPTGEFELRAAKSGYFTKKESRQMLAGQAQQLDFVLEDGGGRNISTLLGFEIELDKTVKEGNTEKWTGRFVNLRGIAPLFDKGTAISLPFSNINVTFDGQGNALPQNNEVLTDLSTLSLKAFGFLPLLLQGDQRIKVTADGQGQGRIAGKLQIDVAKIQGSRGFTLPTDQPIYVAMQEATSNLDVEVFNSLSGASSNIRLRLASLGTTEVSASLYGFSLQLELDKSFIGTDGVQLVGEINTPALGPVSAAKIRIEEFRLSKELKIQSLRVQQENLPSITIGSWKAEMTALLFNENGFKIGGKLTFSVPQSGSSVIDFANLALGKDALYGGEFSFPGEGISLYKIAQLSTGNKPLGFGRVGNTQVYYLAGSANMKFGKLFTKAFSIPSFQVQTDGRFMIEAPINQSAELGFATFKLASLTLSTLAGQAPYIAVQGEFSANFPGLKFEMSSIRFSVNTAGQVGFSVGVIGGELSVSVLKVGVKVGLHEHGFEGAGKLAIPGTPINAEMSFHYYKVDGAVDIGATFAAGVSIPIGIVEITRVSGGFSYNTGTKKFMVTIGGGATISGMRALVELNPISLTVESGPIITGHVGVVVGTTFKLVDAYVTLNFRDKFFAITVVSDIEPIKGVASARLNGLLKIKWDPNESYVFLGANMDINVLGIFHNYGEFALGVNIENPKNRGDEIAGYFRHLTGDMYNGSSTFSGVYLHSMTEVGLPKDKAKGIGGSVFGVKGWFHTTSDVMLLLNFAENDYRFRIAGMVSAGGEGCFIGFCVGGEFFTCYALMGGYSDAEGWMLAGKVGGYLEIQIGKRADCNSVEFCAWVIPCGGRVCLGGHASISISSRRGIDASFGMGTHNDGNLCN